MSKQCKGLSETETDTSTAKRPIKNGLITALKEVEKHTQGKKRLQPAADFIREMRKELK